MNNYERSKQTQQITYQFAGNLPESPNWFDFLKIFSFRDLNFKLLESSQILSVYHSKAYSLVKNTDL